MFPREPGPSVNGGEGARDLGDRRRAVLRFLGWSLVASVLAMSIVYGMTVLAAELSWVR